MAGTTTVERSAVMAATPATIMAHLDDLRAWRHWSPWEGLDPELQRAYSGPDSGVGANYAWKGNSKAGAGTMTIVKAEPEALDVDVRFTKPFPSTSISSFRLQPADGGTRVTWTMTSPTTWMTRVAGLFIKFDKLLGADIEKGLAGLAAVTAT